MLTDITQQHLKILIIYWHWADLKISNLDTISIIKEVKEEERYCKIICIDDGQKEKNPERIKQEILSYIDWSLQKAANIVLLLHRKSFKKDHFTDLEQQIKNKSKTGILVRISYFGGGHDFIYYNNGAGLLNSEHDCFNSGHLNRDRVETSSVLDTETGKVLKSYFHPVWDYYFYRVKQLKRKAFELNECLSIYLISAIQKHFNKNISIFDLSELNPHWLLLELKLFCEEKISSEYPFEYQTAYHALVSFFKEKTLYKGYLEAMRDNFGTFINTMPGLAYDA